MKTTIRNLIGVFGLVLHSTVILYTHVTRSCPPCRVPRTYFWKLEYLQGVWDLRQTLRAAPYKIFEGNTWSNRKYVKEWEERNHTGEKRLQKCDYQLYSNIESCHLLLLVFQNDSKKVTTRQRMQFSGLVQNCFV